jgi:hypothetical protein
LAVVAQESPPPELFSEHTVLRQEILGGVLLSAVYPVGTTLKTIPRDLRPDKPE